MTVSLLPSPQLMVTVWLSPLSGSTKTPLREAESFSLMLVARSVRSPSLISGGLLSTVTRLKLLSAGLLSAVLLMP